MREATGHESITGLDGTRDEAGRVTRRSRRRLGAMVLVLGLIGSLALRAESPAAQAGEGDDRVTVRPSDTGLALEGTG